MKRSKAFFVRGSYTDLDFSRYDVIFAYLSPAATEMLWSKAFKEMKPNALLVSHEFPIIGVVPHMVLSASSNSASTYVYKCV
jgi:hypothetical protein